MTNHKQIIRASETELHNIKNNLIIDKMKLDKFFSVFLDQYEMTEEELDTPEWFTYREMLKEYDRVNELIKAADYRIQHA